MPVYVYRRQDGSTFELEQRITVDALVSCPTTGQRVERVMQPFTPHYKGTGFYSTDHRKRTPNGIEKSEPGRPAAQPEAAAGRGNGKRDSGGPG